jgi:hypothetical protein
MVQNLSLKRSSRGAAEMKSHATVRVYSFRVFDLTAKEMRVAKFKAQREAIVSQFGGQVLERTGEDVAAAELDQHGRYRRIATAWGELG